MNDIDFLKRKLSLIQNPNIQMILKSIMAKNTTAEILLHSNNQKQTNLTSAPDQNTEAALVFVSPKIWIFLGDSNLVSFNQQCREFIQANVESILTKTKGYYKIFFDSPEWCDIIQDEILRDISNPIKEQRICFHKDLDPNPEEMEIFRTFIQKAIDSNVDYIRITPKNLQDVQSFKNWAWVESEIKENAIDSKEFLQNGGIGVIAAKKIKENAIPEIIGWILSEFHSPKTCGIGIEVSPSFRQQGIGSQLGIHFLIEAQHWSDLNPNPPCTIIWDAWGFNLPSRKLAEIIRFSNFTFYDCLYGYWDTFTHAIERTYFLRKNGKFEDAAIQGEKAISEQKSRNKSISYKTYYLVACAYALAENLKKSIEFLEKSIRNCTDSLENFYNHIKNDEDLKNIAHLPEFHALIKK